MVTRVAVPQAKQWDSGNHSERGDSCWCLQSAGLPDGFLIDFLVLSQFFTTPHPPTPLFLSVSELCCAGLIFWTCASHVLLRWALVYWCAWGVIYERKSSRVQFLTAGPDNGGDWMKQFVTSSLTLTFTGCWPSVSKELCLELMLGDGRAEIDFLQLIQNVYSQ